MIKLLMVFNLVLYGYTRWLITRIPFHPACVYVYTGVAALSLTQAIFQIAEHKDHPVWALIEVMLFGLNAEIVWLIRKANQ